MPIDRPRMTMYFIVIDKNDVINASGIGIENKRETALSHGASSIPIDPISEPFFRRLSRVHLVSFWRLLPSGLLFICGVLFYFSR